MNLSLTRCPCVIKGAEAVSPRISSQVDPPRPAGETADSRAATPAAAVRLGLLWSVRSQQFLRPSAATPVALHSAAAAMPEAEPVKQRPGHVGVLYLPRDTPVGA